ncbi:condensation domain-containing protein, partial [Rhodococcus sp. 14C212]|uniref:condensation domain-containing protein n=1 Tax=Rhodococcus sp. 14C212 TaxID=2711209 RepID=UPI003211D820
MTARSRPERVPLSWAQQRMWFLNRFDPTSPAYNLPVVLRLTGELDTEALRAAVRDVVARHESLRTVFPDSPNGPYQVVLPTQDADPELTVTPVIDRDDMRWRVAETGSTGFDVTAEVPLRARLYRLSATEHVLVVVAHHIAADGMSMGPLVRDVTVAYSARHAGAAPEWEALPVQYADFSLWQREMLGREDDPDSLGARQLAFWRHELAGLPEVMALPTDHPRPAQRSLRGDRIHFTVDARVHRALTALAREHGVSVFMAVHAALAVLLARLSGDGDIPVGVAVAGRGDAALDELVGMFVNTLVLRTPVDPRSSFAELLEHVREVDLAAFAHAEVPFERVVDELAPVRSTAHAPLFQVAYEFQNISVPSLVLPGLTVTPVEPDMQTAKFDLQLSISERQDGDGAPAGLSAGLTYATDLYNADTVRGFAGCFVRILEAVTAAPGTPVGDVDILDPAERSTLLSLRGPEGVAERTLPEILTAAVAVNPDAVAVSCEGDEVTYRELDERSNRLARLLIERGAGPDRYVAIGLPRSIESVAAVWAVAKTGAAFVPVDPSYPPERISYILRDCGAVAGVTVGSERGRLPGTVQWMALDDPALVRAVAECSPGTVGDRDRAVLLRMDHPAYLIYTSGSTGQPKGVVVSHRGLANLAAQAAEFADGDAKVLHGTSPSFDAAILELILAFAVAARMVVVPRGVYGGPELAALLAAERVTHACITPAVLATVDPAGLDDLGCLIVGGETCSPRLVAQWAPGRRIYNGYGPTEATVQASAAPMTPGAPITLGSPAVGFAEVVLDGRLRPVPVGVVGELY